MRIPMRGFTLSLILLFAAAQAQAVSLTFAQAKDMALKNSYVIKSYKAGEEAAGYVKDQAIGAFLPTLSLHQTLMKTDEPGNAAFATARQGRFDMNYFTNNMANPDRVTSYTTQVQVMQPVFMQGQIYFGVKQADMAYQASRMETERATQFTLYNLHMAFYGLALAEKALDTARHSYERTERYYRTAKDFFNNGLIVKSDLMVSESYLLMNEQAVKEAEKQHAVATSNLQRLLDTDEPIKVVWTTPELEFSEDVAKYTALGLSERQDLIAMQNYLKSAEYENKKAKSAFLPSVYLFADYQRNDDKFFGDNGNGTTYGVQADLNLFKGFSDHNKVGETKSRQLSLMHRIADKKLEIKSEIKNSYYGVIAASKQIEASKKRVEAAFAALTITENRFNEGLSKITELLDREVDLKQAELSLYMSEYQEIVEMAGLHLAAGNLK
ncbi:TolC family protein [Seleniivibrio woodruffii]|uniref:TolC family protein n=1 Tax=Seleniivibrio woodruffii TaxID=1078050 RepID=UPI00240A47CC|nr:TolC family protein [Seleniivibrio woodruffii]